MRKLALTFAFAGWLLGAISFYIAADRHICTHPPDAAANVLTIATWAVMWPVTAAARVAVWSFSPGLAAYPLGCTEAGELVRVRGEALDEERSHGGLIVLSWPASESDLLLASEVQQHRSHTKSDSGNRQNGGEYRQPKGIARDSLIGLFLGVFIGVLLFGAGVLGAYYRVKRL